MPRVDERGREQVPLDDKDINLGAAKAYLGAAIVAYHAKDTRAYAANLKLLSVALLMDKYLTPAMGPRR